MDCTLFTEVSYTIQSIIAIAHNIHHPISNKYSTHLDHDVLNVIKGRREETRFPPTEKRHSKLGLVACVIGGLGVQHASRTPSVSVS